VTLVECSRRWLIPMVYPSINASIALSGLLYTHDKTVSVILTWQTRPTSERRCLRTGTVHGRQVAT